MMHTTVRPELHFAKNEDYQALHALMARGGYMRSLVVDGAMQELPEGIYVYEGPVSVDAAVSFAEECVSRIRRRALIFVTNGVESRIAGQPKARIQSTREMLARISPVQKAAAE